MRRPGYLSGLITCHSLFLLLCHSFSRLAQILILSQDHSQVEESEIKADKSRQVPLSHLATTCEQDQVVILMAYG